MTTRIRSNWIQWWASLDLGLIKFSITGSRHWRKRFVSGVNIGIYQGRCIISLHLWWWCVQVGRLRVPCYWPDRFMSWPYRAGNTWHTERWTA